MQLKESLNQLREKIIKAGSGDVISVFTEKFSTNMSDREYNAIIERINTFISDNPEAIDDDIASKLERVLKDIKSTISNKARTYSPDSFGIVRGANPHRILGNNELGDHPADKT